MTEPTKNNLTTEEQLQAHLRTNIKTYEYDGGLDTFSVKEIAERITCNDGFALSVQASKNHYCAPKTNDAEVYTEVEIGFPSGVEGVLMPYAEDSLAPMDTVYGFVPVSIVCEVIDKHGGIKKGDK